MNMYSHSLPHGERQPLTAVLLSIIPGLGQFYVGDKRKGILFLDVALINYVLLSVVIFGQAIASSIDTLAHSYRFEPNRELVSLIQNAHFGSPASMFLIAAMLAFIWYAACDAYDRAFGAKRKQIYGDSILDLSEATSGSYVGHIAVMLSCLLLAALFVRAPHYPRQITEIEFEMDNSAPAVKKPPITKIVSKRNTDDVSKRRPEPPRVAHQSASAAAPEPHPVVPAPHPVAPAVSHMVPALPAPPPVAIAPKPLLTPMSPAGFTKVAATPPIPVAPPRASSMTQPSPIMQPAARTGATAVPLPPVPGAIAAVARFAPGPQAVSWLSKSEPAPGTGPMPVEQAGTNGMHGPTPVAVASGAESGTTGAPKVVAVKTKSAGFGNGDSFAPPAPVRSSSMGTGKGVSEPFAVGPSMKIGRGSGSDDESNKGNPARDSLRNGAPGAGTRAEVDFGAYMAHLQRLIKRHWFPPSDTASKKIVVCFKVSLDGTMSDLHLVRGCGIQRADNAALRAVQDASASFAHLPQGSPESVDIEFTFDYNVFTR